MYYDTPVFYFFLSDGPESYQTLLSSKLGFLSSYFSLAKCQSVSQIFAWLLLLATPTFLAVIKYMSDEAVGYSLLHTSPLSEWVCVYKKKFRLCF